MNLKLEGKGWGKGERRRIVSKKKGLGVLYILYMARMHGCGCACMVDFMRLRTEVRLKEQRDREGKEEGKRKGKRALKF